MSLFLTSCFTGNFGKKGSPPVEEYYEFSTAGKVLRRTEASERIATDLPYSTANRFAEKVGRQRWFRWQRLEDEPVSHQSMWSRMSRFIGLDKFTTISSSVQSKSTIGVKTRSSYDGYVNHGFSDIPSSPAANEQPTLLGPPVAQMAKFRVDLANVKSDLMHLQEVLSSCNVTESGLTQTVSDCTLSSTLIDQNMNNVHAEESRNSSASDEKLPQSETNEMENLQRLLKVRTEAMDACLVDNAELRQAVGELTNSLKQLQLENESLRQRLNGNVGSRVIVSSSGPQTWSFSSESIPNTPCSPSDITQQTNFKLVNGQSYSTLS